VTDGLITIYPPALKKYLASSGSAQVNVITCSAVVDQEPVESILVLVV